MSFIDLKKRLSAKKAAPPVLEVVTEVLEPAPPPAPPIEWESALLNAAVEPIARQHDVLLVGLGPWGHTQARGLPEALVGRARMVVAVDPDRARLVPARGFCHRTLESEVTVPDLASKLGGQKFSVVMVTDTLVTLDEPLPFLRGLKGLLAPEGRVLAVVPNFAHAERRLALLAGDLPREFEAGGTRQHYTRQRLRELFALAGYGLVQVTPYRQPAFGKESDLVPELFPPAILEALGPDEDAQASHFIVQAVPASAEALLRELFDEQDKLRKATRNEVARVQAACDELTRQVKEADHVRDGALAELAEARKKEAGLNELVQRAEQNVRRLGKEIDDAQRELVAIKASFWYRVGLFFKKHARGHGPVEFVANEPVTWKYDPEPRGRYPSN
jgi:hypothetical protein